ncbi:MAG: FAD-dependent oxidoreductase, partial [Asticcacaulis sp.]
MQASPNQTHGLWALTAPPAPDTVALNVEVRADVAIVGAGYTGLSCALHLAQKGVKAVVFDAAGIGFGGAGRNVGLVNAGMWVMPDELPKVLGATHGERLLTLLGDAPRIGTVGPLLHGRLDGGQPPRASGARAPAGRGNRCREPRRV